ncbi:MAG: dihydroneopterin aldolase, partial [Clostridia bacterium]|nr:dihydroneopterin aldolase [Clostridia bacterium]
MDKIIIKDLKVFAFHGVNPEEKADGQNFILDIVADVDLSVPCKTDNVDDTVSY